MTDYARVKRNVAKMIRLGAPESEIDQYVASEGVTPAQLRGQAAPKPKAPAPPKARPPITAYADGNVAANAKAAVAITPQVAGGLLASAATLVSGQLLVSTIRMFLFDQERWKELDEKDDLAGYLITTAMGRTFATPLDPIMQAYTGYKYSGSAASNLSGPALSNIVQQVDAIGTTSVRNSEKTNTAEYNRAKAIYRLGIGPGAGMALQFIPGGSYISGAAGLATMAVTSTTTADAFAEKLIGEKGSQTDPETGEITGPPKKKKKGKDDAASKYVL